MPQTSCPGPCNTAYRKAEEAYLLHGTDRSIQPAWGMPVQCYGCVERTRQHLSELPELLVAVHLEAIYGTSTPSGIGTTSGTGSIPAWPGQASRLLIDRIVGEMAELQADVLIMRGIWSVGTEPARPSGPDEGKLIGGIVAKLDAHWDWAMQHHPAAGEQHSRDNANPGGQVTGWYRTMLHFTKRNEQRDIQRLAPCPRCHGPYLVESRELRLINDEPFIECRDPDCGSILTRSEYDAHVKGLIRPSKAAA